MMVWVCSLPLKAFDLAGLMLRKFYKACFSCCTNQAIAGSPQVPVDDMTFSGSTRLWHTSKRSKGSRWTPSVSSAVAASEWALLIGS